MRYLAVTAFLLCMVPISALAVTRAGSGLALRGGLPGIAMDHSWTQVETPTGVVPDFVGGRLSYGGEARQLRRQIRRARDNGWITRCEERYFKREVGRLQSHAAVYGRDGFSGFETRVLDARTLYLRGQINAPANLTRSARADRC